MYSILSLVDEHGEIVTYSPTLAHQVQEIAAAIRADREANLRRALASARPVTAARQPTGDSLCVSLFPGLKPAPEGE